MLFNFKLVYSELAFEIGGSDMDAKLESLFNYMENHFKGCVNLDLFYLDFVVSGVHNGEVMTERSAAVTDDEIDTPVGRLFGRNGVRHQDIYVSFYVRPMVRTTGEFIRLDNYNIPELFAPQDEDDIQHYDEVVDEPMDISELSAPPGLSRNVDIILVN